MSQLKTQWTSFATFARYSKLIFTPVAVIFLCYLAFQETGTISRLTGSANTWFLLISMLLWMIAQLVLPVFTMTVFRAWHHPIHYRKLLAIHCRRLPAKYIPGGIWHSVARTVDYANIGIGKKRLATYLVLEHILAAAVTLAIGGTIILSRPIELDWTFTVIASATLISLIALIITPGVLRARIIGDGAGLGLCNYLASLGATWLFWILAASSFVLFIHAFDDISPANDPVLIGGVYMFSWGIGFISVFAPQGLGIFELVAGSLLNTQVSLGYLTTLLAGFRLIVLGADACAWGLTMIATAGMPPKSLGFEQK